MRAAPKTGTKCRRLCLYLHMGVVKAPVCNSGLSVSHLRKGFDTTDGDKAHRGTRVADNPGWSIHPCTPPLLGRAPRLAESPPHHIPPSLPDALAGQRPAGIALAPSRNGGAGMRAYPPELHHRCWAEEYT